MFWFLYAISGDAWHLRKTNWCGEEADLLDDLDLTLENILINDGDHILLKNGKLPPKVTPTPTHTKKQNKIIF